MLPECFFARDGDAFVSTELTRGPWSNEHQHGGPPSALLARAAETFGDDARAFFVARLTIDYLRPIPIAALKVSVEPQKLGKTAQRVSLRLTCDGEELARATALRIRRAESRGLSTRPPPLASPDGLPAFTFPFFRHEVGYHRGIEARYLRGRFGDSEVAVWMRQTAELVKGETPSGLQRVTLVADAESGVCNPLDIRRFTFVNPDLTVLLDREPVGEWVCLDALSTASGLGIGLAQAAVHDRHGPVGRSAQTLVVEERG
ncbi:MAG: thioesterase family protein [Archangiaceae bacterium]|nr:thioesterase family protein [Archangiaceae bacterium]